MVLVENNGTSMDEPIALKVGFYDPFSIFQGGFRSDFEKHIKLPSFYWKDNQDYLRVIKNVNFNFEEEIPHSKEKDDICYLKLMFISCQSIDDYRAKVRPLILQWLSGMRSNNPKIPHFIFFFENTELRTAADKYLKTNLFNKVKLDFDQKEYNVENIFKIKSIYQSNTDKIEVWKSITTSIKTLLSNSINSQLATYKDDFIKIAQIFQDLNQKQDALSCYSKLFNKYPFIKMQDFESVKLEEIENIFNPESQISLTNQNSKFLCKNFYYKNQENILLTPHITDIVYMKNICRLSQTLISFLNSLEMCYKRNEISYTLINKFLDNKHLTKLLKKHGSTNDELINNIGNLKLLQRNELIALGISKGYYVKGSMSIIDVQFSNDKYKIMDSKLNQFFSTEKTFLDKIIELTRDLISLYNESALNVNNIASLSTELALILYYSSDDYESSYDQLVKSYDFFFSNGWKYIGIALLEVYIENLDKLIDLRGLDVVVQLLSSYVTLAVNKSSKFDEQRFKSLCSKLEKNVNYKINDLLKITQISSVYCDSVDTYKIDVKLQSKLCSKVDKIKLSMRNKNNETIQFICNDVEIKNNNVLTFSCCKINFDTLKATNISLILGKFEIIQNIHMNIHITPIDSFYDSGKDQMKSNTQVCIKIPSTRYLHSDQLLFQAKVGSNKIKSVQFIFMKIDPDKLVNDAECELILTTNNKISEKIEFDIKETEKKVIFIVEEGITFESGNVISLYIPYFFPPDVSNTLLNLSYSFSFVSINSEEKEFSCSQKHFSQIESSLPIAVATDEIFRSSYSNDKIKYDKPLFSLFSQYTINSISGENPVRVQNVVLTSKNSKIETWKSPKNIVAFIDQGSTFFFKISDFKDSNVSLTISYNTIKSEVIEILSSKFAEFLEVHNEFKIENREKLAFISTANKIWENLNFKNNFYALTGKIHLLEFNRNIIDEFKKYIDRKYQNVFRNYIEVFIDKLSNMEVTEKNKDLIISNVKQELCITVSLPSIDMVNVVEYKFEKALQYLVCEPINVKVLLDVHILGHSDNQIEEFDSTINSEKRVRFQSDDNDDKDLKAGNDLPKTIDLNLEFTDYEQKWIISGVKDLTALVEVNNTIKNDGSKFEYDLTFLPLKPGKLQLPGIIIKNQSSKDITMELDYKNTAESVLVVSELNKIIHSF